jgi:hypothetical protein
MSEDIHAPHTQFQSYPIRFGSAVAENESLEGGGGGFIETACYAAKVKVVRILRLLF